MKSRWFLLILALGLMILILVQGRTTGPRYDLDFSIHTNPFSGDSKTEISSITATPETPFEAESSDFQTAFKEDLLILEELVLRSPPITNNAEYESDPLLLAAEKMGQIKQAVSSDPSLRKAAMGFYGDCRSNTNLPQSLRAVCLENEMQITRALGEKSPNLEVISPAVVRLAKELAKLEAQSQQ